ncbi:hypothetical protein [Winogradskyella sp. A3E31]|uniref:hypothetical protein n=1 Tax=Winogradskyella sp. A3E31 TaxID=3349637 RepID=UPI00398AEA7B
MTKILTILLVFIGIGAFGQNVQIDTLNLKKSERFKELQSEKMNYPLIRTGNKEIDSFINFDLKNKFTSNEYPTESIDSTLIKWAGDQIIHLDFNVTYNQNGILSLNVSAEGCGAYCSYWTEYFNYSTVTGNSLDISEIIDISGEFKTSIFKDKETQFKKQKIELKEMLNDSEAELDQSTYEWALEYYENCENSFDLKSFSIYPDYIEINKSCHLPNAIKNLTPILTLKYKNAEIKEYLKIKN